MEEASERGENIKVNYATKMLNCFCILKALCSFTKVFEKYIV